MTRRALLLVALIATLAILFQNQMLFGGFVWAAIHGAGAGALLTFVPASLAIGVLWFGCLFTRRLPLSSQWIEFVGCALAILVVNEILLPATPLKVWRSQRGSESVIVQNVRDELLKSSTGEPLGVRITFEAQFRDTGAYLVSASTMMPLAASVPSLLSFDHSMNHTIEPAPSEDTDSPFPRFQSGVAYHFTQDMMPNFVGVDYNTKPYTLCLQDVTTKYVSESDVRSALLRDRDMKFRTAIHVDRPLGMTRVVAADYVTSRGYDLEAIRQHLAPCPSRP
jgi:hypothetical protein